MQPKGRRPAAEARKPKPAKKPRAKPLSLYGVGFEEVIRRLAHTPPPKKRAP